MAQIERGRSPGPLKKRSGLPASLAKLGAVDARPDDPAPTSGCIDWLRRVAARHALPHQIISFCPALHGLPG
ncbi:MAG: hypothetical protein WA821_05725 [Anaerolineales bacterium]